MFHRKSGPVEQAPTPIEVRVDAAGVTYIVAGQEFRCPRELALLLADKDRLGEAFKKAEVPEAEFAEFDTAENAANLERAFAHGLGVDDIAKLLGVDRTMIAKFRQYSLRRYASEPSYKSAVERLLEPGFVDALPPAAWVAAQRRGATEQNPAGIRRPIKFTERKFLKAFDVAGALRIAPPSDDLAATLGVVAHDLNRWFSSHEDLLKILRK